MSPTKREYPKDEFSAEWFATYCWNFKNNKLDHERDASARRAQGTIPFSVRFGRDNLRIKTDDIDRLETYEQILEFIETEIAIRMVTDAASTRV